MRYEVTVRYVKLVYGRAAERTDVRTIEAASWEEARSQVVCEVRSTGGRVLDCHVRDFPIATGVVRRERK